MPYGGGVSPSGLSVSPDAEGIKLLTNKTGHRSHVSRTESHLYRYRRRSTLWKGLPAVVRRGRCRFGGSSSPFCVCAARCYRSTLVHFHADTGGGTSQQFLAGRQLLRTGPLSPSPDRGCRCDSGGKRVVCLRVGANRCRHKESNVRKFRHSEKYCLGMIFIFPFCFGFQGTHHHSRTRHAEDAA